MEMPPAVAAGELQEIPDADEPVRTTGAVEAPEARGPRNPWTDAAPSAQGTDAAPCVEGNVGNSVTAALLGSVDLKE